MPPPPTAEKSSAASTARTLPPEQPPTTATLAAVDTATPSEPEVAADKEEAAATGVPASTSSFLDHVSLCFCTIVESLALIRLVNKITQIQESTQMYLQILLGSHHFPISTTRHLLHICADQKPRQDCGSAHPPPPLYTAQMTNFAKEKSCNL